MNSKQVLNLLDKYEAQSCHPNYPIVWKNAINDKIADIDGMTYIDFTSAIFVTNSGHSTINEALTKQINTGLIYAYDYNTEIKALLAKTLVEMTPRFAEKVAFYSSGAEAVEIACKIMRRVGQVGWLAPNTTKRIIVSFAGSMHGKSYYTSLLKDNDSDTDIICNLLFPGTITDEFHPLDDPEEIAGIMIESYRGWDAKFMPKQYVQDLVKWAKENHILVCFDEVQGGFWRTGKMFAYQHYEVEPDMIVVGKGLGGGMPISAVLGWKNLLDLCNDLTSTFSGHALCCAGALENLKILKSLKPKELHKRETIFREALQDIRSPLIKSIHCTGLIAGLVLPSKILADKLCYKALHRGLLIVQTGKESVKIGPPLTISISNLKAGLTILTNCIEELK